jgi:hypothetical protein
MAARRACPIRRCRTGVIRYSRPVPGVAAPTTVPLRQASLAWPGTEETCLKCHGKCHVYYLHTGQPGVEVVGACGSAMASIPARSVRRPMLERKSQIRPARGKLSDRGLRRFLVGEEAVADHRTAPWRLPAGCGSAVVFCFSIDLAITKVTAGVIAALSIRHASRRWSGFNAFAQRAPYFFSAVIICVGLYVGW